MSYINKTFGRAEVVGGVCDEYISAKRLQDELGIFVGSGLFEYRGKKPSVAVRSHWPRLSRSAQAQIPEETGRIRVSKTVRSV